MRYILITLISVACCAGAINYLVNDASATGCPTNFVNEHIDNALKAFDEKNAEEVKNQLDLAKQALSMAAEEKE